MFRFDVSKFAHEDTLLPKLISGELRMPDVEKILEDVV